MLETDGSNCEDIGSDNGKDLESGNADKEQSYAAVPLEIAESGPPPFNFFRELNIMNKQIFALRGFPSFMLKWAVLQLLAISGVSLF